MKKEAKQSLSETHYSCFKKNKDLLLDRFPVLKESLFDKYTPSQQFSYQQKPNPAIYLKGRALHSARAPYRQAQRLIEQQIDQQTEVVVQAGMGLAYQLEKLLELRPQARLILIEPDPSLFLECLYYRDYSPVFASPRFSLLFYEQLDLLPSLLEEMRAQSWQLLFLRPLMDFYPDFYSEISTLFNAYIKRKQINSNTLNRFGRRWVRNLAANLPWFKRVKPVANLEGRFKGIPALLLSAGPSLDQVLDKINSFQKSMLIICVDTAFLPCLRRGIVPDILVVVDPQYWNSRHLDQLKQQRPLLVSESSSYPGVFQHFKGDIFFASSLFPLGREIEQCLGSFGKLGAGGSVATSAWDLARLMDCSPLYIAGLDLAYPNWNTHCRGALFEERCNWIQNRFTNGEGIFFRYIYDAYPHYQNSNQNSQVLTDKRLSIYKDWFEQQLEIHQDFECYNLSANGLKIKGMPYLDSEFLKELPECRDKINQILTELREQEDHNNKDKSHKLLSAIEQLLVQLEELKELAEYALCCLGKIEENKRKEDINPYLKELDNIDKKILAMDSRHIAAFIINSELENIGRHPQTESHSAILEQSFKVYQALADSCREHQVLLKKGSLRI